MTELPGLANSVWRAVATWIGARERLSNASVGSVDVLLSGNHAKLELPGPNGPIDNATHENVLKAFKAWVLRCQKDPNSLALLHWMGHGSTDPLAVPSNEGLTLYCEDLSPLGGQKAISLSKSLDALRHIDFAHDCLCFVDVCRDDELTTGNFNSAWDLGSKLGEANNVVCLSLCHDGTRTICRPTPSPEVNFLGGTIMTEALLDGIDRYGGQPGPGIRNVAVTPWSLESAISRRFDWWRQAFHIPEETVFKFGRGDGSFEFITIPHRGCMVKIGSSTGSVVPTVAHLAKREVDGGTGPDRLPLHKVNDFHIAEVDSGRWWAVPGAIDCSPYPGEDDRTPVEAKPIDREEVWS